MQAIDSAIQFLDRPRPATDAEKQVVAHGFGLAFHHGLGHYIVTHQDAIYLANHAELQALAEQTLCSPFQPGILFALWATQNQLVPYVMPIT